MTKDEIFSEIEKIEKNKSMPESLKKLYISQLKKKLKSKPIKKEHGGGIGGTSDASETGQYIGGTAASCKTGEMIGGTMQSSFGEGGGIKKAVKNLHDKAKTEVTHEGKNKLTLPIGWKFNK